MAVSGFSAHENGRDAFDGTSPNAARAVSVGLGAVALAFGLLIAAAPLPILLDRFVPDDAFYYFQTARVFAATGFSSFDDLHFTNGYHPLWFLLSVPVYLAFPDGGELPLRALLFVQAVAGAATAVIMARAVASACGPVATLVTGLLWLVVFHRVTVNGLETAVQGLLFALLFERWLDWLRPPPGPDRARGAVALGVFAALFFLARTDGLFLAGLLGLGLLRHRRGGPGLPYWVLFALPVAVTACVYLGVNLVTTAHLLPVSGAAKMYHSEVARTAAIAAEGSAWRVYLANTAWPVLQGARWAVVSVVVPILVLIVAAGSGAGSTERRWLGAWPFVAAVWATFLFYGTAFYGGFSSALWYYGPLTLLGWFGLAAIGAALTRPRLFAGLPWVWPFALVGVTFGWLGGWQAALALAGGGAARQIAVRVGSPGFALGAAPAVAAVVAVAALPVWLAFVRGVSVEGWAIVTTAAAAMGGLVVVRRFPRLTLVHVAAGLVLPTLLVHGVNLRADLTALPGNWNYHLYLGADWARRTLPEDATIWSGSAGILGYFSGRRVVNTDGLANSYEYLNGVLRGTGRAEYLARWDYAIDAYGENDDSLSRYFPDGCFVPIPDDWIAPGFPDGAITRRLRVYQMRATGVVACR